MVTSSNAALKSYNNKNTLLEITESSFQQVKEDAKEDETSIECN